MSTTPHIDFTIWGEGEYPLLGLIKQLEKEGAADFEDVPRLIYRSAGDPGEFKATTAKSRYLDLTEQVYPDFSDFIKDMPHIPSSTKVYLTLETSRGCHWNRCKFCSLNDGYRYRHRSPESIAAEMEHMFRTHKINHYHLMGTDNVGKNLEDFERLLDILIESSLKNRVVYHIHSEIIPHNLNARIIEKMAIAGFIQLQIGYEAISDSILSKMDKKSDVADLILFLKFAKKFGIATLGANIITGIVGETPDDVRQSTENLPFFRFFLNSGGGRWVFTHRLGKMRLDPRSRFKKMVPPEEQKKWNQHTIAYLLPRDLMEEEMQSHVFGFARSLENAPQWDAFAAVNMFYEETGFSCKIMSAGGVYYYDEYMGDKLINHIAFNEPEYTAVLKASNDAVTSLESLFEGLRETFPAVTRERLGHIVEKLRSTYILYANEDLTRIVSVIDIK